MLNRLSSYLPTGIVIALIAGLMWIPVKAQPAPLIYVCIDPVGAENEPYLITFRNTELFGLVVSEDAQVTAYSDLNLSLGVYTIIPDVDTGNYQRKDLIGLKNATNEGIGERACGTQYPQIITSALLRTEPELISPERVAIIEVGGTSGIIEQPFLGVFAFHFITAEAAHAKDFQVVQLDAQAQRNIEMSFPFLPQGTRFSVTATKSVAVRRSFQDDDTIFSEAIPSDVRSIFRKILLQDSVDLFQMMGRGSFRIYPRYGLVADYPAGGFLRIDLSSALISREPKLSESVGLTIRAIDGDKFDYATLESPDVRAGELDRAQITEVNGDGRLIVQFNNGPKVVVMKPWLVEVDVSEN